MYDNEKVFPHFHQSVAPPVRPCYADAPVKMRGTRQGEMREGDSSAAAQLSEQEDMRMVRKADKPLKNALIQACLLCFDQRRTMRMRDHDHMAEDERTVISILKAGKEYRRTLDLERCALVKEMAGADAAAADWDHLDPRMGDLLRSGFPGEAGLKELREEELRYLAVRRSLWEIEPALRQLLIWFYEDRRTAGSIARELRVSDSTFWRRRRRAMCALLEKVRENVRLSKKFQ